MKRLLNEQTGTVHKPEPGTTGGTTTCGALRHVPSKHIESFETTAVQFENGIDRCGRCFEDAGGY